MPKVSKNISEAEYYFFLTTPLLKIMVKSPLKTYLAAHEGWLSEGTDSGEEKGKLHEAEHCQVFCFCRD